MIVYVAVDSNRRIIKLRPHPETPGMASDYPRTMTPLLLRRIGSRRVNLTNGYVASNTLIRLDWEWSQALDMAVSSSSLN